MTDDGISRRQWLRASPLGFAPAYLLSIWPEVAAAQEHAHRAASAAGRVQSAAKPLEMAVLDRNAAAEIEAMAAQIIPSDGTPGAREAGVIYFIDRALATFHKDKQDLYRQGLQQAQAKRSELFPESKTIAALAPEQQIALLHAIDGTPFFEQLRFDTILGFLGDPSYGGNRNQVGWQLIGFEERPTFEPPFGYYDAHASEEER